MKAEIVKGFVTVTVSKPERKKLVDAADVLKSAKAIDWSGKEAATAAVDSIYQVLKAAETTPPE